MKRIFIITLAVVLYALTAQSQTVYDYKATDDAGREVSLADYRGKVLLVVNTATRCGFTPQYKELEELYERYRAEGFEVLDFPCNQFGQQAPGSISEIHQFCTANFNIEFPQFDKVDVNGPEAHPLFTFLKSQQGFAGFNTDDKTGRFLDERFRQQDPDYALSPDIKWNFTKFLIARDGRVVKRFEPTATAQDMEADIKAQLAAAASCCQEGTHSCCQ